MYRFKEGNTLVNVSNSILSHFGVSTFHNTYKPLDEILSKNSEKKVVLFLFDAFAKEIIEKYKKYVPFIYEHQFQTISSVFPPTTVAATTSLLSGRYPSENGHLGWWSYLNGVLATTFSSTKFNSKEKMDPPFTEILKYESIMELINQKAEKEIATSILSFNLKKPSMKGLIKAVNENLDNHQFIYAYLTEPDHSMHGYGTGHKKIKKIVKDINKRLKRFVNSHPDTLVISLADHGMIDTSIFKIPNDILDLCENRIFSMEGRAATFFVPKENQEEFLTKAKKYFSSDFEIYTKDEVKSLQILGPLDNVHPLFDKLLGDFLVVATNDKALELRDNDDFVLVANHAGGKEEESLISLCIYNN